jgi:hypothetical protein
MLLAVGYTRDGILRMCAGTGPATLSVCLRATTLPQADRGGLMADGPGAYSAGPSRRAPSVAHGKWI